LSESEDKPLDVGTVEVLARRRISNYFSPEWNGQWGGPAKTIGVYATWPNVTPVTKNVNLFNAMDPAAEGLGMNGAVVIRFQRRPAVGGISRWIGNVDGQGYYVENPDRDQANTSSAAQNAGLLFLRATSVAVRTDADRLAFGGRIYIPEFKVRTVDDSGGLHGNRDQIDVWRGQGDQALKNIVDNWGDAQGVKIKTCLKIIEQE
jgi:3D (Asp-Asp-Asp) domain-containing protein